MVFIILAALRQLSYIFDMLGTSLCKMQWQRFPICFPEFRSKTVAIPTSAEQLFRTDDSELDQKLGSHISQKSPILDKNQSNF